MGMPARSGHATPAVRWYREPAVVSAVIGALAIVVAAVVSGVFGVVASWHPAAERARPAPSGLRAGVAEAVASPVTFDAFAARMTDTELTELQRRLYLQDHLGRRVEWDGEVRRVRPAPAADGEPRFLLGISPEPESAVVASCWFGAGWGNDLGGLTLGQRVTVSCVLEGYGAAGPTLGDCRLKRV